MSARPGMRVSSLAGGAGSSSDEDEESSSSLANERVLTLGIRCLFMRLTSLAGVYAGHPKLAYKKYKFFLQKY